MAQDALKLSLGGDGKHRGHEGVQIRGCRHPFARLALRDAAIEDELDLEPTERGGGFEHLALDTAGAVPGRLAAGGGVECKDQPPAPATRVRGRCLLQLVKKLFDLGGARLGREPVFAVAHLAPHAGLSHTEVSWKTAPPRGRPGSALVNKLIPPPSSKAWLGHSPSTITTRLCNPSKPRA